jgi:phage gp29-like protein
MPKKSPPTNRRTQRAASTALAKRAPTAEVLTLAEIQRIRRSNGGQVRGGRVVRQGVEFGASGTVNMFGRIMNEDYNPLFDGKNALVIYDQMDRSDGQIGAAGEIIKQPIRAAQWRVIPPEKATEKEKLIAEAAHAALFGEGIWPQGEGWDFTLRHLLMRVSFGFGMTEKVWTFDEDKGLLRWKRFAPRLPRTVDKFNVWPDGTLKEIVQYVAMPGTGAFQYKTIPSEYAVLSVREREGDNFFGKSIYRRLYKHWFYKDDAYRIDGIRLDRYGVGVPVAKIEEGHILEVDELDEIELVLQALRSHERAYIIEPPKVTFRIMVPEGGHGGASGLMESVNHHDSMIVRGILATFLSDHAEGLNTNRTRTLADVFLHALKAEAKAIANDLMSQAVRPFCDFNFSMVDARFPQMEITGIGDLTVEQLATSLAPLVSAKVITPEDTLEDVVRKVFGLPPMPKGWKRGETKPMGRTDGTTPAATGEGSPPTSVATKEQRPQTQETDDADDEQVAASNPPVVVNITNPAAPPGDSRHQDVIDLANSIHDMARAIEHAPPPPQPQLPPIVIQMTDAGSTTTTRKIIRDPTTGRIDRIEFWQGQPRDAGRFDFGKSGGAGGDTGGGAGGGGAGGGGEHAAVGSMTGDQRSSNEMSASEASDPKFQAAVARVQEHLNDPDVSDFERSNVVSAARAYRESDRPFEEIHAGGSKGLHTDANGNYTPERQALHEKIIAHYDSKFGPPQEHPEAIVTGGLPGSGKSSTLPRTEKHITINADDFKEALPEYNGVNAGWVHEESDHLVQAVTYRAIAARQHIVMDVTMKSFGAPLETGPRGQQETHGLGRRIQKLDQAGYKITAIYNDVPVKVATDRAMKRYVSSGRFVPPSYIRSARTAGSMGTKNRETFERIKPLVKSWKHYNNNVPKGQKPILVDSRGD